MARYQVYVTDFLKPPADIEQRVLGRLAKVTIRHGDRAGRLPDVMRKADGLLCWHEARIDAANIARLDRCKIVVRCGVGFDNVDLQAAGRRGIVVCNVPDYGTNEVADHAIALLLALRRGIVRYDDAIRRRRTWTFQDASPIHRLTGQTIGIVGLGRIGTATAGRAAALGLKVLFYDPYVSDGLDKALQYERAWTLEDLLRRADIISLHTPLSEDTRHLINDRTLRLVKRGCTIVNTARGPVIDTGALYRALKSGRIGAAGLDVLEEEPAPADEPLIREWRSGTGTLRDRVIITPHAAFYSEEGRVELREKAAEEIRRVLGGEKARNCVNGAFL